VPLLAATPALPIGARRGAAVEAGLRPVVAGGALAGGLSTDGGKHRGAIGPSEGEVLARLVAEAVETGVPVVGIVATSGADVTEGVASLHAWGAVARALTRASGVVPIVLVVAGPCVSGPALLLGLADLVVMTSDAFAFVSGPAAAERFTGLPTSRHGLGGADVHAARSGVASLVADDEAHALHLAAEVLSFLPPNNAELPPCSVNIDPVDRPTRAAAAAVPAAGTASYDVREVVADLVDDGWWLELDGRHAPNVVIGLARIGGHPVGVVANQPGHLAGTLDIEASQKAAAFVQLCDAFGVSIVSLVDTPGFQPGKDIEWRGMIRHGAELVHAYAAATVPRLCVILRKAYGGAYIVMDSKTLGSDLVVAWPAAEIAVMGAPGAVQILAGRTLRAIDDDQRRDEERAALEAEYAARYCTPVIAAHRGYVDDVIDPLATRHVLAAALVALRQKRSVVPARRHSNTPL
jgi:acetyl-CoA carboxylase carboxyltransferase component